MAQSCCMCRCPRMRLRMCSKTFRPRLRRHAAGCGPLCAMPSMQWGKDLQIYTFQILMLHLPALDEVGRVPRRSSPVAQGHRVYNCGAQSSALRLTQAVLSIVS